ncbi:FIST N-terminal domain-containing protein [Paracoccus luteus]|uniref:FIST N-terminal domain-containing protein n=1 Tax=Paracoccus luteus TaxID=2508543 RepID=UPI001FE96BC0|nr:FIST N-terminal domain-containing protein [Paracoccus luteus]
MTRAADPAGRGGDAGCDAGLAARADAGPVSVTVRSDDPHGAQALHAGLVACDPALVLLFGSPRDALAPMAERLHRLLPGVTLAGCSSAGEIGRDGYQRGTVLGIGFPRATFRAGAVALRDQGDIPVSAWLAALRTLHADFVPDPRRAVFGILLADGRSGHEDVLAAALDAALPDVPIVGGSAGDGLDFGATTQILDGRPVPGAAVFVLVETALAVAEVSFAHFSPTEDRAVVTAADPHSGTILELNAEPAADEYARLAGLDPAAMEPADFASHPLLLRMGRRHHVRAISEATAGRGLKLMSSIDTGTVLTLGRAEDVTQGFGAALDSLPQPPLMVLGFDCILRRLAVERAGMAGRMGSLFARYRVAGFNTYGEQHAGMHVNQTFVGLALMPRADGDAAH